MTKLMIEGVEYWDSQEIEVYTASIGVPIKITTVAWYADMSILPVARMFGHKRLFDPDAVRSFFRPDRVSGPKPLPVLPGLYSTQALAATLGITEGAVRYYLRAGALTADFLDEKGRRYFNEETLQAMHRGEHKVQYPTGVRDETSGDNEDETGGEGRE